MGQPATVVGSSRRRRDRDATAAAPWFSLSGCGNPTIRDAEGLRFISRGREESHSTLAASARSLKPRGCPRNHSNYALSPVLRSSFIERMRHRDHVNNAWMMFPGMLSKRRDQWSVSTYTLALWRAEAGGTETPILLLGRNTPVHR